MKIDVIIEARLNSSRLPKKHLKKVLGRPVITYLFDRLKRAYCVNNIILATTNTKIDDELVEVAIANNIKVFRGSENDVMGRVLAASKNYKTDIIVSITADCVLVDPLMIDEMVKVFKASNCDYITNTGKTSVYGGMNIQVYYSSILDEVDKETKNLEFHREHVTSYILENPRRFKIEEFLVAHECENNDIYIELDWPEDFIMIKKLIENYGPSILDATCLQLKTFLLGNLDILNTNIHLRK